MSSDVNHQWILKRRPQGLLKQGDLEYRELPLPELEAGQCLIRILYIAMDPATRTWISESGGYLDPLPLESPVMGVTIGRVVASENPDIPEGMTVAGVGPWARYMVAGPEQITPSQTGAQGVLAPVDTEPGTSHVSSCPGDQRRNGLLRAGGGGRPATRR